MKLEDLNNLEYEAAQKALEQCCGASKWITQMIESKPFADFDALLKCSHIAFEALDEVDWLEAFEHHPQIGNIDSLREKFASTADWASNEQGSVTKANEATLLSLQKANADYLLKNGFIFIVCATGKSAKEMLSILESRLGNDRQAEIQNAAIEQNKITQIRLEKLLS